MKKIDQFDLELESNLHDLSLPTNIAKSIYDSRLYFPLRGFQLVSNTSKLSFNRNCLSNLSLLHYSCSCREELMYHIYNGGLKSNNPYNFMYFGSGSRDKTKKCAAFINSIEDKLQLENRTTFFTTEHAKVVLVYIPAFWRQFRVRFELFTILLRAGCRNQGKSIDDTLNSLPYSRDTKNAIDKFLKGNYYLSPDITMTGWVKVFRKDKNLDALISEKKFLELSKPKK